MCGFFFHNWMKVNNGNIWVLNEKCIQECSPVWYGIWPLRIWADNMGFPDRSLKFWNFRMSKNISESIIGDWERLRIHVLGITLRNHWPLCSLPWKCKLRELASLLYANYWSSKLVRTRHIRCCAILSDHIRAVWIFNFYGLIRINTDKLIFSNS